MNCPNCKQVIRDGSKFCPHCGYRILCCPTCGASLTGKERFCTVCGSAVLENGSKAEGSAPVIQGKQRQRIVPVNTAINYTPLDGSSQTIKTGRSRHVILTIFLVLLLFVSLGGIGFASYQILTFETSSMDGKSDSIQEAEEEIRDNEGETEKLSDSEETP